MKFLLTLMVTLTFAVGFINGQSRGDLEKRRQKMLEEISYAEELLKQTERQRSAGITQLQVIVSRIGLRENVIEGYKEEIDLIGQRIELNTLAIDMMEHDLQSLRRDYAENIRIASKASKGYPLLAFILAARDFNQGYKRLKYLQQTARYRRRQAEIISDLVDRVSSTKERLVNDRLELEELRNKEENQKQKLLREQGSKQRMVQELTGKEKQLRQELQDKKRVAQEIEKEILRIIEEEKKRSEHELTPEQKLTGTDFQSNKGALPWPLERGVVTAKFGTHNHPVLKIKEENIGIEITTRGPIKVRAVFRGEVAKVFGITGGNMAVIIRHGNYMTVYQNVINVEVKPGDIVDTKQIIGDLFVDEDDDNNGTLSFMIFQETNKHNPELWLAGGNN